MVNALSTEQIRHWLLDHFPPGGGNSKNVPLKAFCRAAGINPSNLYHYRDGAQGWSARTHANLTKIIELWETGMIDFPAATRKNVRVMRHLDAPRKMPLRFVVNLNGAPSLDRHIRWQPPKRIPGFREILFDKKG